jgi:hypothetical protein
MCVPGRLTPGGGLFEGREAMSARVCWEMCRRGRMRRRGRMCLALAVDKPKVGRSSIKGCWWGVVVGRMG